MLRLLIKNSLPCGISINLMNNQNVLQVNSPKNSSQRGRENYFASRNEYSANLIGLENVELALSTQGRHSEHPIPAIQSPRTVIPA
jgi:hypothetical protein